MTDFHLIVMTNYVQRADGTGFNHHTATDVVADDILANYIADARTRWATVEDRGPTEAPSNYTTLNHLTT